MHFKVIYCSKRGVSSKIMIEQTLHKEESQWITTNQQHQAEDKSDSFSDNKWRNTHNTDSTLHTSGTRWIGPTALKLQVASVPVQQAVLKGDPKQQSIMCPTDRNGIKKKKKKLKEPQQRSKIFISRFMVWHVPPPPPSKSLKCLKFTWP